MELGIAADVGTLQRLPKVVGCHSWVRELVYTARKVEADEALKFGLVRCVEVLLTLIVAAQSNALCHNTPSLSLVFCSNVYPDKDTVISNALKMAEDIARKSPVAIQGSKVNLNYSRDHSVKEALHYAVSGVPFPDQCQ